MPQEKRRFRLSELPELLKIGGGTKTGTPTTSSGHKVENPAAREARDYNFKQRLKKVAKERGEYDPEPGTYERKNEKPKLRRKSY